MTTTTTTPSAYATDEALTGRMTAREWAMRYWPGVIDIMGDDEDRTFAEITERGHAEAAHLGLARSETGAYPPVVWELDAARNT